MNILSFMDAQINNIKIEREYCMMLLDCEHIDTDRFCEYMDNLDRILLEIKLRYQGD